MISGVHVIIYSKDAEADRAFFRDVLEFAHVDAGEGWLVFKLPPGEMGVHEGERNDVHEFYLMCDDVEAEAARLNKAGATCTPVADRGWGLATTVPLPGGGKLGLYQPRHARP